MYMNEKLLQKKSILLKRISEREYYQLLSYVESIFLADADLIILLARKFSNLFDALLPLVIAENRIWIEKKYQEMVNRRGGKAPVIISSRALEYYEEDIKNHTYESIMLVDDMIVHGGTLQGIYKKIFDMFEKNEVRPSLAVKAYASQRGLRILGSGDYGVDIVNRLSRVKKEKVMQAAICFT